MIFTRIKTSTWLWTTSTLSEEWSGPDKTHNCYHQPNVVSGSEEVLGGARPWREGGKV